MARRLGSAMTSKIDSTGLIYSTEHMPFKAYCKNNLIATSWPLLRTGCALAKNVRTRTARLRSGCVIHFHPQLFHNCCGGNLERGWRGTLPYSIG